MRTLLVLVVMLVAGFSRSARAQDFVGARALALGEAYRAVASGNDGIYMNPAGLTTLKRYAIETHYAFNLADEEQEADASIVDSKTSPLAMGVGYTFDGAQFTRRATLQHRATLALAYALLDRLLSVGAGFKYVNVSDAFAGNYLNALSADVGALSRMPFGLSVAAVGYNLVPIQSAHVPLSAGFAAAWDLGPLSALMFGGTPWFGSMPNAAGMPIQANGDLRGPLDGLTVMYDWHINFRTLRGAQSRMSGGVEYLLGEIVPLRAGWLWDEENNTHDASIGAGFIVPSFGLDVAYQQSIYNHDVLDLHRRTLAISLKFFLPV